MVQAKRTTGAKALRRERERGGGARADGAEPLPQGKAFGFYVRAVGPRTFCNNGNVLCLCCPVRQLLDSSGYGTLEMWVAQLRS